MQQDVSFETLVAALAELAVSALAVEELLWLLFLFAAALLVPSPSGLRTPSLQLPAFRSMLSTQRLRLLVEHVLFLQLVVHALVLACRCETFSAIPPSSLFVASLFLVDQPLLVVGERLLHLELADLDDLVGHAFEGNLQCLSKVPLS